MSPPDPRPVCTKGNPLKAMGLRASHPEAVTVTDYPYSEYDQDHGDVICRCPCCGYQWWNEGPDY